MGHSEQAGDAGAQRQGGRDPLAAAAPLAVDLADLIQWGEAPVMFGSKRDGRCLRVISAARRLDREGLAATLRRTIETRPDVQMEIQQHDMSVRTQPALRRALLSWLRGWAYLTAGSADQALKDAQAAVAYGPTTAAHSPAPAAATRSTSSSGSSNSENEQHFSDARTRRDDVAASGKDRREGSNGSSSSHTSCTWPAAYILLAEAQAAVGMPAEQVALTLLKAKEMLLLQQAVLQSAPCLEQHGTARRHEGKTQQEREQEQQQQQEHAGTARNGSPAASRQPGQLLSAHGTGLLAGHVAVGRQLVVLQLQLVVKRLDRVAPALEQEAWEAVLNGGAQGLQAYMDRQAEERLPEFLRPRPKWYYYEQWMRGRIQALLGGPAGEPQAGRGALEGGGTPAVHGGSDQGQRQGQGRDGPRGTGRSIPEAVMAKLLATDANDLDLLLQHPLAALAQVEEYTRVLQLCGEQHLLLTHTTEPLGWDEMQALNAPAWVPDGPSHGAGQLVGLPIGSDAEQVMAQARAQAMAEADPRVRSGSEGGGRLLLDCSPQGVELARRCLWLALEEVESGGGEGMGAGGKVGEEAGGGVAGVGLEVVGRRQLVLCARGLAERAGLLGAPPEGPLRLGGVEVAD